MNRFLKMMNDAYDEWYQLTHLGVSQFDMDSKQLNREIDKDLFEYRPDHYTTNELDNDSPSDKK